MNEYYRETCNIRYRKLVAKASFNNLCIHKNECLLLLLISSRVTENNITRSLPNFYDG